MFKATNNHYRIDSFKIQLVFISFRCTRDILQCSNCFEVAANSLEIIAPWVV